MNSTGWIQEILDEGFATLDYRRLAAHLAEDVVFEVTPPEGGAAGPAVRGREAVLEYFTRLGEIVTFWQVRCFGEGDRVVAIGAESFTIPGTGLTLGGEFALFLQLCGGSITHFLVVEDLSRSSALEGVAVKEAPV
jgi:ketosteroid isomerase-like protein